MPGNYRYEEERHRGPRGTSRRGFGERGRDDDMELEERERYGPSYGRDQGEGRFQGGDEEGSWRRPDEHRDAGRSLGGRARLESHVGKGPKGWQRSDERIREDVCEALARHPEIDASDLEITVQEGEVTLSGTVADRRAKRLAEDVAEDVLGVKDVQCRVRVQPSIERASFGSFSERDVTPVPDREGRITREAHEVQSRRTGIGPSGGGTAAR